jgi:hypothetical protein
MLSCSSKFFRETADTTRVFVGSSVVVSLLISRRECGDRTTISPLFNLVHILFH